MAKKKIKLTIKEEEIKNRLFKVCSLQSNDLMFYELFKDDL